MDKGKDNKKEELQLTPVFLKTFTNKFDLETIFILNLSNSNISNLGAIEGCINVMLLDLSSNNIRDITPLYSLTKIQVLKLGKNYITNIDPLSNTTKLAQADLHGNQIKTIKSVGCFSGNKFLSSLSFQLLNGNLKNPLCDENNYRDIVFDMIKSLKRLDGIKKGLKFSTVDQIKTKEPIKFEMKNTTDYWYTEKFPKVEAPKTIAVDDKDVMKSINVINDIIKNIERQLKG